MSLSRFQMIRIAVVLAVLGVLAAYLWPKVFESYEEATPAVFQGDAAKNSFYVLQEMLRDKGIDSVNVETLAKLPPAGYGLVLASPTRGSSGQAAERLIGWVEEGGHLLVIPAISETDALLDYLAVWRFGSEMADEDDDQVTSEFESERPDWPKLHDESGWEILRVDGAADASWMLSLKIGQGAVTIVAEGTFLHNGKIGLADHPLIAWRALVLDDASPPEEIWWLLRDPVPSIWALLGQRARPVGISLALLSLFALLAFARRMGPILEDPALERRHLEEHVQAVGRFMWFRGLEDTLIRAARSALGRRLGQGRLLTGEALRDQAHSVMARARLSQDQVDEALTASEVRDRQRFVRIIHTLETLRRSS